MGFTDRLKQAGFMPKANTDGEYQPIKGTYKAECKVMRFEKEKETGDQYIQAEWKVSEVLNGDEPQASKFSEFKRRYWVEKSKEKRRSYDTSDLANDCFTASITLDTSSDVALEQSFSLAIDKPFYIRAWHFSPEGEDRPVQMFVVQKEKVAEKKRSKDAVPF